MKKILLFILVLLSSISLTYSACSLNNFDETCFYVTSPYEIFDITLNPQSEVYDIDISIYKKGKEGNKILLEEVDENQYTNKIPFTELGVYVLEVKGIGLGAQTFNEKFEFVFDNSQPRPPVLKTNLISNQNSLQIVGNTSPNNVVIIYDRTGNEVKRTNANPVGRFGVSVDLNNNANYYAFTSLNSFGVESEKTERIIYFQKPSLIKTSTVSSITLNDLETINDNTAQQNGSYVTGKRNFYIEGSITADNLAGNRIFINGVPTITGANGDFGGFVTLNSGENNLEIKSGSASTTIKITYVDTNFRFTSNPLSSKKVTVQNSLDISGTVNIDSDFNAYLNSRFIGKISPDNLGYTLSLTNLAPGRNTLFMQGDNEEYILDYIYYDSQNPTIDELENFNMLAFKLSDDIGIDYSTLKIKIDGEEVNLNRLQRAGDYFELDLTGFENTTEDINHDLEISVSDKAGKTAILDSIPLQIHPNTPAIKKIILEEGVSIGDKIFTKTGVQNITLIPNQNVVFRLIYLDTNEITNYEIALDGTVRVQVDFKEASGELVLDMVDTGYNSHAQRVSYVTNVNKPQIELNYAFKSSASQNSPAVITGQINSDSFDWDSFTINTKNNFERYGNMFETYIPDDLVTNNLLIFTGSDINGEGFDQNQFGNVISSDNEETDIAVQRISNYISGAVSNPSSQIDNLVTEYDGYSSYGFYINPNSFDLSANDREGLRTALIKGHKTSSKEFSSNDIISVDNTKPQIFFLKESGNIVKIIIDTTHSELRTINITKDGNETERGECLGFTKISKYSYCYEVELDSFNVKVEDEAGNVETQLYSGVSSLDAFSLSDTDFEIYFNGNDLVTNKDTHFIQGQITTSSVLNSVSIDDKECNFDDHSFVCSVELVSGQNTFTVTAKNIGGQTTSNTITINRLDGVQISLGEIVIRDGIYKIGETYYINVNDYLDAIGFVDTNSLVDIVIGEKTQDKISFDSGNINVTIDISDRVSGKQTDNFETYLRAEDEAGNTGVSNRIRVIFDSISKTILDIFVK